jgi:uncharacterized protein YqeY
MSILDVLKADQLSARKSQSHTTISILTTLIGEGVSIGKNSGNRETTDVEMIALIKKFIKNNEEVITALDFNDPRSQTTFLENIILKAYLPKQLTESELRDIIGACVLTGQNMGGIMATLKTNHSGLYDGKLASAIIKEIL